MKARFYGIEAEGTPEEISKLIKELKMQKHESWSQSETLYWCSKCNNLRPYKCYCSGKCNSSINYSLSYGGL